LTATAAFAFPPDTQRYLRDLGAHNDKRWFDANRERYERAVLEPAKALVEALGPGLDELVPGIAAEPRVNGSIFRINRDVRFSKDKTPYKDHLDLWFWEGERRTALSSLFLRIAPDAVIVGAGAHGFDGPRLDTYRQAVTDPTRGDALIEVVTALEHGGHAVEGEVLARLPRGFDAEGERARLLRHKGLTAMTELPGPVATDPELVSILLDHWHRLAPLHTWLRANVG
jgi:uncharacterized protein (TIGR02453 family)